MASALHAAGVPAAQIAEQLGHKDAGITMRTYTHLFNRPAGTEATRAALAGVPS